MRKFAKERSGLAAVEFALILPVLLALVFGAIEISSALVCKADVTNIASTAADLIAQETTVDNNDFTNVFATLNALIYPFPTTGSQIIISSIISDGHGGAMIAWSKAQNATAHAKNAAMTVPAGLLTSTGSVILSEVTYPYNTPSTYLVHLPITMTNTFYSHPRRVSQISCPTC